MLVKSSQIFSILMYQSAAAQQTSKANFFRILKTVDALRINETKVTSKNIFIDNFFPLESERIK